ncbi:MAG: hypothetical protein Q8P60_08275 [Pseudorhodobacter sp.]|nr:hypothetical protein [Pseudorhodobacter sp.]
MEKLAFGALALGLAVALLGFIWQMRRAVLARAGLRGRYFDACKPLFDAGGKVIALSGFPRISGRYGGRSFDLQALPDTLTFRKLPALWLRVTLPGALPLRATFDLMQRPTGGEPFSNFHHLPDQITPPPGFPPDCVIRSDDPTGLLPDALLRRNLGLFAAPQAKELVISPKGLRLVWLAEEADRTRYLLFRDAEMGRTPLPAATLRPLLEALLALQADILTEAEARESRIA